MTHLGTTAAVLLASMALLAPAVRAEHRITALAPFDTILDRRHEVLADLLSGPHAELVGRGAHGENGVIHRHSTSGVLTERTGAP